MTNLAELLAHCESHGIGLSLDGDSELTIDAPKGVLSPRLIDEFKAQKSDLLAFLRNDPVTPETRRQVFAQLVERVNSEFKGWPKNWPPIDWSGLVQLEELILTAETMGVLLLAVENYERSIGIVPE